MMATQTATATSEQLQALLNGPAGTPPVGMRPNFDDPPNLNAFVTLTLTFCVAFTTLAVLMRMYTKLFLIRSTTYEDYAVVIAWLGQIGETIPSGFTTRYGAGVHVWNVQLKTFFKMLYFVNWSAIVYGPVIFVIKLSILLQYLRIFVPNRKGNMFMFIGVHICIWSCLIFYLVDTIFEIVMCSPREKIWNPLMTTGHCFNTTASFQATGVFNIVSDFAILILPMPTIWKLQMPPKKKFLMIAIFATGFFACVTSIVRTYYTWILVNSPDFSYNVSIMGLWTYAEIAIGIVVSCLPVIPKFFQHFGPKVYGTFSFRPKSGTRSGHGSDTTGNTGEKKVSSNFKRPFAKRSGGTKTSETWNGSRIQSEAKYITLNEIDTTPPEGGTTSSSAPKPDERLATRQYDLESGQHGIQVVRTMHLKTELNTASATDRCSDTDHGW